MLVSHCGLNTLEIVRLVLTGITMLEPDVDDSSQTQSCGIGGSGQLNMIASLKNSEGRS